MTNNGPAPRSPYMTFVNDKITAEPDGDRREAMISARANVTFVKMLEIAKMPVDKVARDKYWADAAAWGWDADKMSYDK